MQAYIIQGYIKINGEEIGVKLVSKQNPITSLKHKFLNEKNAFKEITSKALSLRPVIGVLILVDKVYFISMAGEKLFNMERSYKAVWIIKYLCWNRMESFVIIMFLGVWRGQAIIQVCLFLLTKIVFRD